MRMHGIIHWNPFAPEQKAALVCLQCANESRSWALGRRILAVALFALAHVNADAKSQSVRD